MAAMAAKRSAKAFQQREAVCRVRQVLGHDHHAVEEGVHRITQLRQERFNAPT